MTPFRLFPERNTPMDMSVCFKYIYLSTVVICTSSLICFGQSDVVYSENDLRVFSDYVSAFGDKKDKPVGELVVETGKYFSGKPYVGGTLDHTTSEKLVVDLTKFDCTTLVETCLALSRMLGDPSFDSCRPITDNFEIYTRKLQEIRYRSGNITGYPSRLHYFSDWIYDNQLKGIVKDVTQSIGGVEYPVKTGFMSSHPDKYPQLVNNPLFVQEIAETESNINARTYYYIPKASIVEKIALIQTGDIIAFTTGIPGLDISHVGFAVCREGECYLLHASLSENKVVVSSQPLISYTQSVKRHTGIMVVRPL